MKITIDKTMDGKIHVTVDMHGSGFVEQWLSCAEAEQLATMLQLAAKSGQFRFALEIQER